MMSRLTRDGTAETVSRDQILRRERGQGEIHVPCLAEHVQHGQPYMVDPYTCYHIYVIMSETSPPLFCALHLFIAILVSHIQRIGRQPEKTTLHSGQSRSSCMHGLLNREMYTVSSVYAIPVAYSFLHVPGIVCMYGQHFQQSMIWINRVSLSVLLVDI